MGIFSALFGAEFAPAKCKTSLRLCLGRVKLLKNKKRVALQALRREIAELMRAGKYDSARVRVEGVLREEAMLEAFEVLDLFCELLVVRLPLISSTADLPADLREAVATVVYASRRASELPELAQIRAQFAAKYGKAFVAACASSREFAFSSRDFAPSPKNTASPSTKTPPIAPREAPSRTFRAYKPYTLRPTPSRPTSRRSDASRRSRMRPRRRRLRDARRRRLAPPRTPPPRWPAGTRASRTRPARAG